MHLIFFRCSEMLIWNSSRILSFKVFLMYLPLKSWTNERSMWRRNYMLASHTFFAQNWKCLAAKKFKSAKKVYSLNVSVITDSEFMKNYLIIYFLEEKQAQLSYHKYSVLFQSLQLLFAPVFPEIYLSYFYRVCIESVKLFSPLTLNDNGFSSRGWRWKITSIRNRTLSSSQVFDYSY